MNNISTIQSNSKGIIQGTKHISSPPSLREGTEGRVRGTEGRVLGRVRTITLIIIHCSAVKPDRTSSASEINRWHRKQGFLCIGYHYVVRRDGSIETGRPESKVGAHCKNHNAHSIGICYEGGLDADGKPADTRTPEQKQSLIKLLQELRQRYPKALVVGHNTLNPEKACPCFDAVGEYRPTPQTYPPRPSPSLPLP